MHCPSTAAREASVLAAALVVLLAFTGSADATDRKPSLNGWDAAALERARAGAIRRLQDPTCPTVLSDFQDGAGHALERNLSDWAWVSTSTSG